MTLSEVAGKLLHNPAHVQPETGIYSPIDLKPASEAESVLSSLPSTGLHSIKVASGGGMTVAASAEFRGHSINTASWAKIRPLSDIRELTEPSLADTIPRRLLSETNLRSLSRTDLPRKPSVTSIRRPSIEFQAVENREPEGGVDMDCRDAPSNHRGRHARSPSPPHPADSNSITSIYSIPPSNVPQRSTSHTRARSGSRHHHQPCQRPLPTTQQTCTNFPPEDTPMIPLPPPKGCGHSLPRRGHSKSPLRHVAARSNASSDRIVRRVPSRTFARQPVSKEILEFPTHRHPRIDLGLDLTAGIFVGGGSIEGTAQIRIDEADRIRHRRTLDIARISVDLLSLEEMNGNRRCVFLNLASELIDEDNPPPANMVDTQEPISTTERFWHLMPSFTNLAFNLSLPLNVGPPPFQSKHARIRYVLCVSLLIRDQGRQYIVRTSEDITVLSVYDPEKALMSLPSPLTASDEWMKARENTVEHVRVTAGLHRQVWVSGTSIYADVHIVNNSRKTIKKIELELERDILCYKHAAASTMEKSAGQARIFDSNEKLILSKSVVKQGSTGWHGIATNQTHLRTCDLEIPRGHATVRCGKYFEVRYFLNVVVGSAHTKLVAVQLPIVLIHMNSLDVVPNSIAQVAIAIEEKRSDHCCRSPHHLSRRPSQTVQGRAFAAPRMQSLDRMRARDDDLQEIGQVLEESPRKHATRKIDPIWDYRTPPSNRKGRILGDGEAADLKNRLRRAQSNTTIESRLHLNRESSARSMRGTNSALGFREAEVREDMELAGLGTNDSAPFKHRVTRSRERHYRFSRKKSGDRWRGVADLGVGWLKGKDGGKDDREREGWL